MKVLFQTRPDYLTNPAGDTVQLVYTGQALKSLGVEIALSTDPNVLLSPYDLVHIFNITRIKESYMFFLNAQKQKKRIVTSPIYWNPEFYLRRKGAKGQHLAAWKFNQQMRALLVKESDLLLPNSLTEAEELGKDFKAMAAYEVIPNGFPDKFIGTGEQIFRERFPSISEQFVLSVARISPRKNQHWLARACKDLGLPLVLAGPVNDRDYANSVRSFSNVIYAGILQGELLASAYAAATIHALPSWFETPGLSSLEAAACGTVVVTTDQGSPREYFLNHALYVNPLEEESLSHALELSLNFSPEPLTEHVRKNYAWTQVGKATLAAYKKILDTPL